MGGPAEVEGFELAFDASPSSLPAARHQFESWLVSVGARPTAASDLVTAASELCTNAIRAARAHVVMRARVDGESVILEVADDGPGFDDDVPEEQPEPLSDAGRGLYVTKQLVDVLWVASDPETGGTIARCARRLS